MNENNQVAIPLYYQIYLQDLTYDYIELIPIGMARTIEEARQCCRLFKEAFETASVRGIHDKNYRENFTVIFKPVLKGDNQ